MSSHPRTSIVIRTKNEAATLDRVLAKVHAQTEQRFEIIVVDSGSTDKTLEIARYYNARIVSIPPAAFRYGYALNLGIENSRGEIAVSISGHTIPYDNLWLANLLHEFEDPDVAGTSSLQIPFPAHPRPAARTFKQTLYARMDKPALLARFLFENSSSAIRGSVWRQVPFDDNIPACEDHQWARQVSRRGYRVTYCPASKVIHSHDLPPPAQFRRGSREMWALGKIYLQQPVEEWYNRLVAET